MGKVHRQSKRLTPRQSRTKEAIRTVNATVSKITGKKLDIENRYSNLYNYRLSPVLTKGKAVLPFQSFVLVEKPSLCLLRTAIIAHFARFSVRPTLGEQLYPLISRPVYPVILQRRLQSESECPAKLTKSSSWQVKPSSGRYSFKIGNTEERQFNLKGWELQASRLGRPRDRERDANGLLGAVCKLKLPNHRRLKQEPDYSIGFPNTKFPFFILEAAVSQRDQPLDLKAHRWVQGNRGHMRVLCLLKMRATDENETGYKVTCTIIKPYRSPRPTAQHPNGYVVLSHKEIDDQEIWPATPDGLSFTIRLSDVLPKGHPQDTNFVDQSISIPLTLFSPYARLAINSVDKDDLYSSSDSDQQYVSSPETATFETEEVFTEAEDSESEDPSYVEHR
ncbi:MAG: hypothetical protein Q9211_001733 [Gyalolechia sp. 1 TL-2023]